jgi:hypothetical protein
MMSRRELNTRDRDFADVWVLSRSLNISARTLRAAIDDVAAHRSHDVIPLAEALAQYARSPGGRIAGRIGSCGWTPSLQVIGRPSAHRRIHAVAEASCQPCDDCVRAGR